ETFSGATKCWQSSTLALHSRQKTTARLLRPAYYKNEEPYNCTVSCSGVRDGNKRHEMNVRAGRNLFAAMKRLFAPGTSLWSKEMDLAGKAYLKTDVAVGFGPRTKIENGFSDQNCPTGCERGSISVFKDGWLRHPIKRSRSLAAQRRRGGSSIPTNQ